MEDTLKASRKRDGEDDVDGHVTQPVNSHSDHEGKTRLSPALLRGT